MQKVRWLLIMALALILVAAPTVMAQSDDEGQECINEHMVLDGDTLSEIAKQYNVNMMELAELNNIDDTSLIKIGDVLCLDGLVVAQSAPDNSVADDTDEANTDEPDAMDPDTDDTDTGDPEADDSDSSDSDASTDTDADSDTSEDDSQDTTPPVVTTPASLSTLPEGNPNVSVQIDDKVYATDADSYYTVQADDRLYYIALAFGLFETQAIAVNGLPEGGIVYEGQELYIPAPSPSRPVPGSVPAIGLMPRLAAPGDAVMVYGYNFPPETQVDVYLEKTSLNRQSDVLTTVTTDENGEFEVMVEVPAEWPDGQPVEQRTVSFSAYVSDDAGRWGMNFFINSGYTGEEVTVLGSE